MYSGAFYLFGAWSGRHGVLQFTWFIKLVVDLGHFKLLSGITNAIKRAHWLFAAASSPEEAATAGGCRSQLIPDRPMRQSLPVKDEMRTLSAS